MKKAKLMALTGIFCGLAVAIMLLGGFIPLATFCCPALAALMLIPIFVECGEKLAYCAYIAISALSLILCPDKEAALLLTFLGHYPILRWRLDQLRRPALRLLAKLAIFNLAVIAMYLLCIFLFRMDALLQEYRQAGLALSLVTLLLGNIVLLVYDRLIGLMTTLYVSRIRGKLR